MIWFALAIVGPFLYAITNYIDKLLLDRYFKVGGVGTLLIFSALLSALALPFLFLLDPTPFQVDKANIAALATVSILHVLVLFFYLKALESEEVSIAIVFYQLVPVFAYGLGYLVLGEVLTPLQITAMIIIILGTSIASFGIDGENRFHLRTKTVFFMIAASFCWALGSVVFKAVALEERVVRALFWEHFTLTLVGVGLLLFKPSYRKHFLTALRGNSRAILSLNVLNETLYMLGNAAFSFAYILAPVALVLLAESYQPLFVLGIGIFLTLFFPRLIVEKLHAHHLWQKMLAIGVTGSGTYLLFIA